MGACEPSSGQRKINPFFVPGWEDSPLLPLCPWTHPAHGRYYVDVDQTQAAFDRFQQQIGSLTSLQEHGRLVLATGESGCGKTSLINRCAAWVKDSLTEDALIGTIIDLTAECRSSSPQSIDRRMSRVSRRLVDELGPKRVVSPANLEYLRMIGDQPEQVYPLLAGILEEPKTMLIILLPPSDDLVNEVLNYVGLTRKRLVLFAESSLLSGQQVRQVEDSQRTHPPIVLTVGGLDLGDADRYARDRLTRHRGYGIYPNLDDSALTFLARACRRWSIARLQGLLCGVYEHRREQRMRYAEHHRVTLEDVAQFYFQGEPPSIPGMGS